MTRRILTAALDNSWDRIARWWLCTRHGHDYDLRCDPPACIDCGKTPRKDPR